KWLRAVKHQRFELGPAVLIETHNLAIENRFVATQMIGDRGAQFAERLVFVTAAGYETALSPGYSQSLRERRSRTSRLVKQRSRYLSVQASHGRLVAVQHRTLPP